MSSSRLLINPPNPAELISRHNFARNLLPSHRGSTGGVMTMAAPGWGAVMGDGYEEGEGVEGVA